MPKPKGEEVASWPIYALADSQHVWLPAWIDGDAKSLVTDEGPVPVRRPILVWVRRGEMPLEAVLRRAMLLDLGYQDVTIDEGRSSPWWRLER